jgi:hypothetical protein
MGQKERKKVMKSYILPIPNLFAPNQNIFGHIDG